MSDAADPPLEAIGGLLLFFSIFAWIIMAVWDYFGNPNDWLFWNIGLMLMVGAFLVQYERMT